MVKVIAVTSGKGGAGKSTCSIGLAIALSKQGKKVLLIDMDEGMRCLDMLLGVSENLLFDLSDALNGRDLSSCLLNIKKFPDISLLAAPAEKGLIDSNKFSEFLATLKDSDFDAVIADLPAGSDKTLYRAFPVHTEFICVCNANPVSVRDAAAIGRLLKEIDRDGRLIINKFEPYFIKNPVFKDIDGIIDQSGLMLLGIVPYSDRLSLAFLNGKFAVKGKEAKAFTRIVKRIYDKAEPLPKLKKI